MTEENKTEKKDLATTITIISLILRVLEWWRDFRKSK